MRDKHKYYHNRSRKVRNKQYITTKNQIRCNENDNGSKFYSDHVMDGGNTWVDFYFLGKKSKVFYNATILTANYMLYEKIYDIARDNAELLVPHNITFSKEKTEIFKGETFIGSTLISSDDDPKANLAPFYGLSRRDWCIEEMGRLIEAETFTQTTHTKLMRDFSYGIGLETIVEANTITNLMIDDFIDDFWKRGEVSSKGSIVSATKDVLKSPYRMSNAII